MSKTFAQAILLAEKQKIRNDKFATLGNFNSDEKKLLNEAFNPYRVFNIRKYDWPSAFASVDPSYDNFFKLLDSLHDRSITGNNAKIAVTAVLGSYTEETATVLARVINKDLECGANRDSFEKIYNDLGIPQFELMLAGKIEEIAEETPESKKVGKIVLTKEILANKYGLIFPVQSEAKYDGCLSGEWFIEFEDGKKVLIKDVVNEIELNVGKKVKSFNHSTGEIEFKSLIAGTKNINPEKKYEWYEITLENGKILPPLTGNHRIFLPLLNCYRRIDELDGSESFLLE